MANEGFPWPHNSEGHPRSNKAGGSARAQAERLRAEAPIRTRLKRLLGVHTDERAYRLGAVGEETVGRRLDKLDQSKWLVLHDIILNDKGTNLDHLVIGPPGVFSLNTKHHPKAKIVVTERGFRVNGCRTNYLPVAVQEATKVARALEAAVGRPVHVKPMIVVMGAELELRSAPTDVFIVRRKDLPKWLAKLPPTIPDDQMRRLMRAAEHPSTWSTSSRRDQQSLSIKPWNRYGLKRLYVNDSTGKSLGFRDESSGQIHADNPADLERVMNALAGH